MSRFVVVVARGGGGGGGCSSTVGWVRTDYMLFLIRSLFGTSIVCVVCVFVFCSWSCSVGLDWIGLCWKGTVPKTRFVFVRKRCTHIIYLYMCVCVCFVLFLFLLKFSHARFGSGWWLSVSLSLSVSLDDDARHSNRKRTWITNTQFVVDDYSTVTKQTRQRSKKKYLDSRQQEQQEKKKYRPSWNQQRAVKTGKRIIIIPIV